MRKLHWTPVTMKMDDTVWASLPEISSDFHDFMDLFQNKPRSIASLSASSSSPNEEKRALNARQLRPIEIIMRKFPKSESVFVEALKAMDDSLIKRDQVDQLLVILENEEDADASHPIAAVNDFKSSNPDEELNEAESFLHLIGTFPRLKGRLIFWRFRQDCEASEEDFCEYFYHLSKMVDSIKSNQGFKTILGAVLKAGNFLNSSKAQGFSVLNDLEKLSAMKDRLRKNTLLYHIVKRILEESPRFDLNDEELKSNLACVANNDYNEVKRDLETMREECSASLKFLLSDKNGNSDMLSFIKVVMESVEALTKVEALVTIKYQHFLNWLGVDGDKCMPEEAAKVIIDLCEEVNNVIGEITEEKQRNQKEEPPRFDTILTETENNTDPKEEIQEVLEEELQDELQEKLRKRNRMDNVNFEESTIDKEKDDEPDELTRFMRDFKNRRSGRKGQN